jgi:oxalate decarboxylase
MAPCCSPKWMAHTPTEVLMKNFGLGREALAKLPTEALYIFPCTRTL